MKRLGYLFLFGGVLSLLSVLLAAKDWRTFITNAQRVTHVEAKIDPKTFDEFVGQYSFLNDPEFVLSFWREGDKFFLQASNQGRIEIFPESELKFFLKIIEAQATFVRDAEGKVMMNRPMRTGHDPKSVDESTDTYDTIDWLIKSIPKNNGRVGIHGVSYDGWLAAVATIDAHPALKASSPQAPMTDTWLGDDFFHNGAFRQSYGYEYVKEMETSKEDTSVSFDKDAYDWYLEKGALGRITELNNEKFPTWKAFVAHPAYDDYWKARGSGNYLKPTHVATLVVGGFWDQEDYYGTLATYAALEKFDKSNHNFIVLGP